MRACHLGIVLYELAVGSSISLPALVLGGTPMRTGACFCSLGVCGSDRRLHPGFGLIDYSVYWPVARSPVLSAGLSEGRPPGERGSGYPWCWSPSACAGASRARGDLRALAFAYDFYFYKTDAHELCFAGDLCRALLYVARCPWPAVVATLATAVVTVAIPCWIIAAEDSRHELLRLIPLRAV